MSIRDDQNMTVREKGKNKKSFQDESSMVIRSQEGDNELTQSNTTFQWTNSRLNTHENFTRPNKRIENDSVIFQKRTKTGDFEKMGINNLKNMRKAKSRVQLQLTGKFDPSKTFTTFGYAKK